MAAPAQMCCDSPMTYPLDVGTTPWSWSALYGADELCRQAEQAESLGLSSFWLPENHFRGDRSIPSPLMLLAAVAARTTTLQLACTSYLIPVRDPVQAAEEVAVLDRLSGGRLILGLGRGLGDELFRAFGIDSADKRKLFQRNLDIMLAAWRGDSIATDGGDPIHLSPLPLQQPSPPIWVAAFGPLALKQVANLGMPYLASPIESIDTLADNYATYHEHMAGAGLPRQSVIPVMRTVLVTDDASETERVRARLAEGVPPAMRERAGEVERWAIVGDRHYVRDSLQEYVERLRISHLILRGGLPGVEQAAEIASAGVVLEVAADLSG